MVEPNKDRLAVAVGGKKAAPTPEITAKPLPNVSAKEFI
jgi:hypothetical protein